MPATFPLARAIAPALVACCATLAPPTIARAGTGAIPAYTLVGQFDLPSGVFDVLPDGRIVSVTPDATIWVQDAANANAYSTLGSTDFAISPFGASFLSVSPDGSTIAIGDGNFGAGAGVGLIDLGSLSTGAVTGASRVNVGNFEARWLDNSTLFVSGADNTTFSSDVFRIDTDALTFTTVVTGVGSGSGGLATDGVRLFVGNGFDTDDGGEPTGNVRAFDLPALSAPSAYTSGLLIADALSANSLGFDPFGNLLIGGGDFFAGSNDFGYAGVIDADAIADAIAGLGVAPDASELRLSPNGTGAAYSIRFNHARNELLVFSGGVAYRYAVPTPGAGLIAALGAAGACARRRRR